jgi:hypothetical protein
MKTDAASRPAFRLLALVAFGLLLCGSRAEAAPQILGIVASNGLPTPLRCEAGYCSAYLASFCLQEGRYAPNSGTDYRLAGGRITILAKLPGGASLSLPAEGIASIRTRSGFTTIRISLPQAELMKLGAVAAAVEIGAGTSVVPATSAGDPTPQTAEEIAAATGPLRRIAARIFDHPGESADSARLVELVINRLPGARDEAAPLVATHWSQVAAEARRNGVSDQSIAAAGAVVAACQPGGSDAGALWQSNVCLEMRQAELMTSLTRQYWDQAAGGS